MATNRGVFIVIDGLDKSGKTTLANKLINSFKTPVEKISFPNRSTIIGKILNNYLKKDIELEDHVAHLLFSANRWEMASEIEQKLKDGISIISDR